MIEFRILHVHETVHGTTNIGSRRYPNIQPTVDEVDHPPRLQFRFNAMENWQDVEVVHEYEVSTRD